MRNKKTFAILLLLGLYNANIVAMTTDIAYMATIGADRVVCNNYQYDQLNRITKSYYNKYSSGTWVGSTAFGTAYAYDMNGNIETLNRNDGIGCVIHPPTLPPAGDKQPVSCYR